MHSLDIYGQKVIFFLLLPSNDISVYQAILNYKYTLQANNP